MSRLIPAEEFAAELHVTLPSLLLMRRRKNWAVVRVANKFFFTEEQREQAIRDLTRGGATSSGLTSRSAARSKR